MTLWRLLQDVGWKLGRKWDDVEPYWKLLENNWYKVPQDLVDTKPDELTALGIPLRFSKDLVAAALEASKGDGRTGFVMGKGKASHKEAAFVRKIDVETSEGFPMLAKLKGEGGQNVKHIEEQTGAHVWVKLDSSKSDGQSLVCEISGDTREAVNKANKLAQELVDTCNGEYAEWLRTNQSSFQFRGKQGWDRDARDSDRHGKNPLQRAVKAFWSDAQEGAAVTRRSQDEAGRKHKVIKLEGIDAAFSCVGRLLGVKGRNVHHIQDQTGAKVWVQEDAKDGHNVVSVTVSSEHWKKLDTALKMCNDLVATVQEEYEKWIDERQDPSTTDSKTQSESMGKGKSKGYDKRKRKRDDMEEGEFVHDIEVEDSKPGFNLMGKIIGDGGRHVHHISDESGAKVHVSQAKKWGPISVKVVAESQSSLDLAVRLTEDLLESCQDQYNVWLESGQEEERTHKHGKSTGKGKRDEWSSKPYWS